MTNTSGLTTADIETIIEGIEEFIQQSQLHQRLRQAPIFSVVLSLFLCLIGFFLSTYGWKCLDDNRLLFSASWILSGYVVGLSGIALLWWLWLCSYRAR